MDNDKIPNKCHRHGSYRKQATVAVVGYVGRRPKDRESTPQKKV